MIAKTFEIRDAGTFIPVMAVKLEPSCERDRYLLARAGYGRSSVDQGTYVLLCQLNGGGGKCYSDPYDWEGPARTYREAARYISENFDKLVSGAVVDVQFNRGETAKPKVSEQEEDGL